MNINDWLEELGLAADDIPVAGIPNEAIAGAILLLMIHKGFNDKVWGKKRNRYWNAYKEKTELCLGAETLRQFTTELCNEMSATLGRNVRQRKIAVDICGHILADDVLDSIRKEYVVLLALAQVYQNKIKENYDKEDEEVTGEVAEMEIELS